MNGLKRQLIRAREFTRRHGFYLSLGACLLLVGGALFIARMRANAPGVPAPSPAPKQVASTLDERLDSVEVPSPLIWPVSGREVLTPHSPSDPTWSDTLEHWQTHAGVDIAAVKGEVVYSAIDGTVTRAERDALMGYVIEVTGEGGLVTRYANLITAQMVNVNDRVKAGQSIGAVGDSSALESGERAHLHFEAYRDDAWVPLP